jgi:His-Xaa-Ser system radical SAM maturase HxsC
MIPLLLPAKAEGTARFVTRLNRNLQEGCGEHDSILQSEQGNRQIFAGEQGLIEIVSAFDLDGDVVCVDPARGQVERLIRAGSPHNTLLITERCDQLCIMCSQPPKKTHFDRFSEYTDAILLAPQGDTIGLSGGEPTLYKSDLFSMIETVAARRPDLSFHILSNAQHFEARDALRMSEAAFASVTWGIPLYSHIPEKHDLIVKKNGAYARLMDSFVHLISAGSKIELRTVLLQENLVDLPELARLITLRLPFIAQWSIMQLENIGFAKASFAELYVDHALVFDEIAQALDIAELHAIPARLFNFPRCTVPVAYRRYALASISDWKRKYAPACNTCTEQALCTGFFEWHPMSAVKVYPL